MGSKKRIKIDFSGGLKVSDPVYSVQDGGTSVGFTIDTGSSKHDLYIRTTGVELSRGLEFQLAATLLPAMRYNAAQQFSQPISPKLLSNQVEIQNILHVWDENLTKVAISCTPGGQRQLPAGRAVGCFFSGGLDSFYTFLKHRPEITHLVFVHGFDVELEEEGLRGKVSEAMKSVAAAYGVKLIEVETNLRSFSDRRVKWGMYHGAALASIAHLLSSLFRKVYIASSYSYRHLSPWGSHPMLDPLWSSEELEIVHDGCEASRVDKAVAIASDETALRHLRVCWRNYGEAYNCGRCEKCVRTMVNLQLAGALERCAAFDQPLRLGLVAAVKTNGPSVEHFARENLDVAERQGTDPALIRALRFSLSKNIWTSPLRLIWQTVHKVK